MSKTMTQGPFRYAARSWVTLVGTTLATAVARGRRGPLAPGWSFDFEIGVRFWRAQFNHAFAMSDVGEARRYFDSLQTWTDEAYDIERRPSPSGAPRGAWVLPRQRKSETVLLYLHGGGYAFHAAISHRFADMLAHHLGLRLFAADYRLTPEHPHPAQQEDALAAYRYLLAEGFDPKRLVVIGDSAGGHLALMSLVALRETGLPQPGLAVGLCPWTDIGARGESLHGNDSFAVRFGEWLVGATGATREALSPINQDFRGLAPIYLQGGGRECLIDMIRDYARVLSEQGCEVTLDVWPEMVHDFQAHGLTRRESAEAIARIAAAIACYVGPDEAGAGFRGVCAVTEVRSRRDDAP